MWEIIQCNARTQIIKKITEESRLKEMKEDI